MVILNTLGKIEKTYISKKLGLYISNLPDGGEMNWNNWQEGMRETLSIAYQIQKIEASRYIGKFDNDSKNIFQERVIENAKKVLGISDESEEVLIEKYIDYLSKNMMCIDFDYQISSIPDGEDSFSCFGGGTCEEDPAEKILNFMRFSCERIDSKASIPYGIYSTGQRLDYEYRHLFSCTTEYKNQIDELIKIGNLLDNYLRDETSFYQLDYLCNALFDIDAEEANTYHYMKLYSLCALFLEKEWEGELDYKLPFLMDSSESILERKGKAELMRKIRNKIAHGDFKKLNTMVEDYAQKYMDGKFWFDYSEYTRSSWILLHISCRLEEVVRKLIYLMLTDSAKLDSIKKLKKDDVK